MLTVAAVLALLAALLHVYFWVLESLTFTTSGRKVFGVPAEDVEAVRPWALNQGYYNLFLAVGTAAGAVLELGSDCTWAVPLILFGTGTMLGAALVLIATDRKMLKGSVIQGTFPALALVALAIHALSR
jgi:putative membrane protein